MYSWGIHTTTLYLGQYYTPGSSVKGDILHGLVVTDWDWCDGYICPCVGDRDIGRYLHLTYLTLHTSRLANIFIAENGKVRQGVLIYSKSPLLILIVPVDMSVWMFQCIDISSKRLSLRRRFTLVRRRGLNPNKLHLFTVYSSWRRRAWWKMRVVLRETLRSLSTSLNHSEESVGLLLGSILSLHMSLCEASRRKISINFPYSAHLSWTLLSFHSGNVLWRRPGNPVLPFHSRDISGNWLSHLLLKGNEDLRLLACPRGLLPSLPRENSFLSHQLFTDLFLLKLLIDLSISWGRFF